MEDVILMSKTIAYFLVSSLVYLEKEKGRNTEKRKEKGNVRIHAHMHNFKKYNQ